MDIIIFILSYTPFWAVPSIIIAGQFAYIYWLKSLKTPALILVSTMAVNFLLLIFYFWVGGPKKVGPFLLDLLR